MGCPKEFSIKGGMGAALLTQPDKVRSIITTLVQGCKVPVTAKIRLLPNSEDTLSLCKLLEECGVSAVGIHGRTREQRPHHSNNHSAIAAIAKQLKVPVIANGGSKEIENHEDIEKFRQMCEASSVMVARAAQWNASVFRREGMLPLDDVIKAYLCLAVEYDSAPANAKYCVQSMLRELQETPRGKKFLAAQSLQDICNLWGLGEFCYEKQEERRKAMTGHPNCHIVPATVEAERQAKRRKVQDLNKISENVISLPCVFRRALYKNNDVNLPKTRLLMWTRLNKVDQPRYETTQVDKLFCAVATVEGQSYTSSYW
ncbi:hypothetical protein B566_EDAN017158 [Ephemera danica]|nr:hypothetical protein B566_EDAN017158 [Ephemera danica]